MLEYPEQQNDCFMLGHRIRRWPSIKPTLALRFFAGMALSCKNDMVTLIQGWATVWDSDPTLTHHRI